jgi:hypothetical protein
VRLPLTSRVKTPTRCVFRCLLPGTATCFVPSTIPLGYGITTHFQMTALIIENTFTSIPDIVQGWPIIGHFSFLCTQRWNSASKLARIPATLPILFLSGRSDNVVPPRHMDNLWEIAKQRGNKKSGRKITRKHGGLRSLSFQVDSSDDGYAGEPTGEEEELSSPQKDQFVPFYGVGHCTCSLF